MYINVCFFCAERWTGRLILPPVGSKWVQTADADVRWRWLMLLSRWEWGGWEVDKARDWTGDPLNQLSGPRGHLLWLKDEVCWWGVELWMCGGCGTGTLDGGLGNPKCLGLIYPLIKWLLTGIRNSRHYVLCENDSTYIVSISVKCT